jgi:hypothetical protein
MTCESWCSLATFTPVVQWDTLRFNETHTSQCEQRFSIGVSILTHALHLIPVIWLTGFGGFLQRGHFPRFWEVVKEELQAGFKQNAE